MLRGDRSCFEQLVAPHRMSEKSSTDALERHNPLFILTLPIQFPTNAHSIFETIRPLVSFCAVGSSG